MCYGLRIIAILLGYCRRFNKLKAEDLKSNETNNE